MKPTACVSAADVASALCSAFEDVFAVVAEMGGMGAGLRSRRNVEFAIVTKQP